MAIVAGTPDNIEFGPCQVTFDAVDLGFFKGGVVFTYTVDFYELEVDQSSMYVGTRVMKEMAMATVPMVETNLGILQNVMQTGTYTLDTGGDKEKIEFGGKQLLEADQKELVITPISDGAGTISTDLNETITIYKSIAMPQFEKTYNREGERVVPVEFKAYRDGTQAANAQLFLLGDATATP